MLYNKEQMITVDIKKLLENDTIKDEKQAIMLLAEAVEELQDNNKNDSNCEDEGLENEVNRLGDRINDLDNDDELKELENRVEKLEKKNDKNNN